MRLDGLALAVLLGALLVITGLALSAGRLLERARTQCVSAGVPR